MAKIMLNGMDYSASSSSEGANKEIYGDTFVSMGRKSGTNIGGNSFAFGSGVKASANNVQMILS